MSTSLASRFQCKILEVKPMPNTRSGRWLLLDCGHTLTAFGEVQTEEGGTVYCLSCLHETLPPPLVIVS